MRKEGIRNKKRKVSTERSSNRHKFEDHDSDIISQLPDDILISIISRLNVQEATTTSILSSRWRYLHIYITRLIFPTYNPKLCDIGSLEYQKKDFRKHVNLINRMLDFHNCGGIVKELKLHMCRMKGAKIKKWLKFALTKEIEIIDITMLETQRYQLSIGNYSFGLSKLISSKRGQPLPALKCLKQLTLVNVEVTDQDFDLLVSNFLALETLSLQHPKTLEKVSIVGHPNLKHFDISVDCELLLFEIRDVMNLLSLRMHDLRNGCALLLENIPKLAELYINEVGNQTRWYDELFANIPHYICDQLWLLHVSCDLKLRPPQALPQPFLLLNVKQLELVVNPIEKEHAPIPHIYPLLEACLSLQKLKIKFVWISPEKIETWERKAPTYECTVEKFLSPNLKVLEIEQYLGCQTDLELASYVINHGMNLERVTVVACDASYGIRLSAMVRAQEDFREITPRSIRLRIIGFGRHLRFP